MKTPDLLERIAAPWIKLRAKRRVKRDQQMYTWERWGDRLEASRLLQTHRRFTSASGDALSSALTYAVLIALGPALLLIEVTAQTFAFITKLFYDNLDFGTIIAIGRSAERGSVAVLESLPVGTSGATEFIFNLPGPLSEGAAVLAVYASLAVFRAGRAALRGLFGHPVGTGSPIRDLFTDARDALGLAALVVGFGVILRHDGIDTYPETEPYWYSGIPTWVVQGVETTVFVAVALTYLYTVLPLPDKRVPFKDRVKAAVAGAFILSWISLIAVSYTAAVADARGAVYGALTAVVAVAVATNAAIRVMLRGLCFWLVPHLPALPEKHHWGTDNAAPENHVMLHHEHTPGPKHIDSNLWVCIEGTKNDTGQQVRPGSWAQDMLHMLQALGRQRDQDFTTLLLVDPQDFDYTMALLDLVKPSTMVVESLEKPTPLSLNLDEVKIDAWPQRIVVHATQGSYGELIQQAHQISSHSEATHLLFTTPRTRPRRTWTMEARGAFSRKNDLIAGRCVARLDEIPSVVGRWIFPGILRVRGWVHTLVYYFFLLGHKKLRNKVLLTLPENWGCTTELAKQAQSGTLNTFIAHTAKQGVFATRIEMMRQEVRRKELRRSIFGARPA